MRKIYKNIVKRLLDILLSICALIILSPFILIVAILVRIQLGSPVLYKQERPGMIDRRTGEERIFQMYKFRSMSNEKGSDGKLLPDEKRLTNFGRILRATSLDELPELINILKGDMSIVGPRPLAMIYLPYYTKKEHHRHDVRPGLTGFAQVNGRNLISWEKKFEYDLDYIATISLAKDITIIIMTIKKVFVREGIGQGEKAPVSLHIERNDWLDKNGKIKKEYEID